MRDNTCLSIIEFLKNRIEINGVTKNISFILISKNNKIIESIDKLQYIQIYVFYTTIN